MPLSIRATAWQANDISTIYRGDYASGVFFSPCILNKNILSSLLTWLFCCSFLLLIIAQGSAQVVSLAMAKEIVEDFPLTEPTREDNKKGKSRALNNFSADVVSSFAC